MNNLRNVASDLWIDVHRTHRPLAHHELFGRDHGLQFIDWVFVLHQIEHLYLFVERRVPEAQLDRFMLKVNVGYPTREEEREILDTMATSSPLLSVQAIVSPEEIVHSRSVVNSIYVDDRVKDYIVNIVWATRDPAAYKLKLDGMIRFGASPRATIYLTLAAKAQAFIAGRGYVTPQDVKSIGLDVLRHRIQVSYEAEAESVTSEMIVEKIFAGLAVP